MLPCPYKDLILQKPMLVLKRDKNGENNFSRHFRQLFEGKAAENNYVSNCAWMKEKREKVEENVSGQCGKIHKSSFEKFVFKFLFG